MDIISINDAIEELENSDTTLDNIRELSSLYIVRDNFRSGLNPVVAELNDVLPAYNKYKQMKIQYQQGKITEKPVITGIDAVCKEIYELITTIYSGTDMGKERRCIYKMLEKLYNKYIEKP